MSLLAELRNKKKARATAIPAIRATRKGENGGGIAGIAGIAIAVGEDSKVLDAANDVQQDSQTKDLPEPDTLHDAVLRMAGWYAYTEADLLFALKDSAANPQDWQYLVCNDVHAREFVSCATCAEWGHVRNEGRKS